MKTLHRSIWMVLGLLIGGAALAYGQVPAPEVDFPYTGNRTAVWVVANLHILFAAFILGAPIFVVVAEWLGYKNNDPKYDRLAKEVIKVTVILYSMTALTGGLFLFVLLGTYPDFSTWLIQHFFLGIRGYLSALIYLGNHNSLYVFLFLGFHEGILEGASYCLRNTLEYCRNCHAVCD